MMESSGSCRRCHKYFGRRKVYKITFIAESETGQRSVSLGGFCYRCMLSMYWYLAYNEFLKEMPWPEPFFTPLDNADLVRDKTDEELAEFIEFERSQAVLAFAKGIGGRLYNLALGMQEAKRDAALSDRLAWLKTSEGEIDA